MASGRVRRTVSLVFFLVIAVIGLFGFHAAPSLKLVDLGALALAFVVPAQWISSPGDVWRHRWIVVASILLATLGWDVGTAAVVVKRDFLMNWPVVYGTSVVFFGALLSLHGALVALWNRGRRPDGSGP